jgi:hypothetical protein
MLDAGARQTNTWAPARGGGGGLNSGRQAGMFRYRGVVLLVRYEDADRCLSVFLHACVLQLGREQKRLVFLYLFWLALINPVCPSSV